MRHTPANTIFPSNLLEASFLNSVIPAQPVSPSVAQYSAGLAHDARNMLAAMDIYCELLAAPGVLQPEHQHFLSELQLLRDSSGQLLDRLLVEALRCLNATAPVKSPGRDVKPASQIGLATRGSAATHPPAVGGATALVSPPMPKRSAEKCVTSMVAELQSLLPMLSALAGPKVQVSLSLEECPECGLAMPAVDFTRVLINLVRNATEAMSVGGRILIAVKGAAWAPESSILLSIEDNGPGIPLSLLERIFETKVSASPDQAVRPRMSFRPRGLGLQIVREFVEASQGTIRAVRLPERGSRFEIVLPIVTITRKDQ